TAEPASAPATVVKIEAPRGPGGAGVEVARYEVNKLDPALEEMRARDKKWKKDEGEATGKIKEAQDEKKEKERTEKLVLVSQLPAGQRPASLAEFHTIWHQPPQPQYMTGTCWSFATASFLESETKRISGREVKLSEMAHVYWEYVAKAKRYLAERGDSTFEEGSEGNAFIHLWQERGAWPEAAYPGVTWQDGRHDHQRMLRDLKAVLAGAAAGSIWDPDTVLPMVRAVLDRDLGAPPEKFVVDGTETTPAAYVKDLLGIDPDAYVSFMSTLKKPFYTRAEFEVGDNWWHDASYHNLPLDEFYAGIKGAIATGYGVSIAIDVSEPGKDWRDSAMFVPDYDLPSDHIDQLAREYRIENGTTTDDHGVHVVGWTERAGHDWFLVKDSGRSSRWSAPEGYYFVRDDYIRLKVLAYEVHRDAVKQLLAKFKG
ncbi:MAG: hypothetical protein JXR83_18050, partial [Deltaproteobacteria bacterium]|nr:hypothetical protein [Deltaproteobacteria bacterium]